MCPCVQNASTIDTEQYAKTCLVCRMVHMSKSVYAAQLVIVDLAKHTINYARCTCRSSNLARIQHIQRQGVIRLVASTIGNWSTCLQPQFCCCLSTDLTLHAECRNDISNQVLVEAIIVHQEVCHLVVLKVPEHTLRKAANRRVSHSRETHGDIVAREHNLIYLIIYIRLVLLDPCQFSRSKIAWRVQQMTQALVSTEILECLFAIGNGT